MSKAVHDRLAGSWMIASSTVHSLVLCMALLLTIGIPAEYYSVVFFLTLLIYMLGFGARLDWHASRTLRPIVGIISLGIIFAFQNDVYDAIRDIWYGGKIIICFLLGYYISRKIVNTDRFFTYFIWLVFFSALIYLIRFFTGSGDLDVERISGIGGLSIISAMAVPLILFSTKEFVYRGGATLRVLIVSVIVGAFSLSFSRTAIGCLILFIVAGAGIFENMKKVYLYIGLLIVATILISPMLPSLDVQDSRFLEKITYSFSEIFYTDDTDSRDMLRNWRGFEAYRAYIAFVDSGIFQQIFGRGWGATVDLGQAVQMSDEMNYEYIPMLHNGYMHILTKYGLLGVVLYLVLIWRVLVESRRYFIKNNNVLYSRLITGLGLTIAYTSLVIAGIFNKSELDSVLIMLGFIFGSADSQLIYTRVASEVRPHLKFNK